MTITGVVITYNEDKHVERCVRSLMPVVDRCVVVDSGSSDATVALAKRSGAEVFVNAWVNHATQLNWAFENTGIDTEWIFRLDADEYVTSELANVLRETLSRADERIAGFTVNRQIHFLGRWIKHGAIYPRRILRIFRTGRGHCEQRWMDEHLLVDGDVGQINADIVDDNRNGLTWWTAKHNEYSSKEVIDTLLRQNDSKLLIRDRQARLNRWLKTRVYHRLPSGIRPSGYFAYRYLARAGFLDGWQGLVFHSLQGFWYRFLVDAKLMEMTELMEHEDLSLRDAALRLYGIDIDAMTTVKH